MSAEPRRLPRSRAWPSSRCRSGTRWLNGLASSAVYQRSRYSRVDRPGAALVDQVLL